MDASMYAEMAEMEKTHWWFVGRRAVVMDVARRYLPQGGKLLDVGLGTGYNARAFSDAGYAVDGVEPASEGVAFVQNTAPTVRIYQTPFPSPEIPNTAYSSLLLLDTLEHLEDDIAALKDVKRVLIAEGHALITVPAFSFLWTKHDERAHHFRRYTKKQLLRVIREAGLEPVKVSYYNFFLFPLIALVRLVTKATGREEGSDFDKTPKILNSVLASLFGFERHLIRCIPLPFGVSLIAVIRKP